ncbi:MAG: NAD-dependent epimerase/dehydratase family protein [Candidatus Dactylopiibacterium sp.]|nr:NAD-dependent epimerase/dehydratase family protein [Candidatus Dactylopiibacterium sp.]
MRLLVTGANGFVGREFCAQAEAAGHSVRRVLRKPTVPAGDHVVADLHPATDWGAALDGIDVVVHLAARVHQMRERRRDAARLYRETNVDATAALARQAVAAGVRRFVFVSSIKALGESSVRSVLTEASTASPEDPYGRSKWRAECELRAISEAGGMEWVVVRPPLVYGAGVGGNLARLLALVDSGLPLPLGGIGARRSYVSVWNLAGLLLRCCEHPAAANRSFLAADVDLTTSDLVRLLARIMGRRVPLWRLPAPALAIGKRLPAVGPALRRLTEPLELDASLARHALGWQAHVSTEEGFRRMVTHYLDSSKG